LTLRVVDDAGAEVDGDGKQQLVELDELCRLAAREMIAVALEAERRAYLERHAGAVDADGRRLVVGNGYAPRA
jgi:putative transposase